MKKVILLSGFILQILLTSGQVSKKFDKTYGAQNLDAPVFIDFKGGNHYVFGNIKNSAVPLDLSEQFGGSDYNLVIYDPNGVIVEDKSFGGSGNEVLNKVIPNGTGGYFLCGTSTSPSDGNKTSSGDCINNRPLSYAIYVREHYQRVASGYTYMGTDYDTSFYYDPITEENKKEMYIVEIDSSGFKEGDLSLCTEIMDYFTISGTTGSRSDSIAYFSSINDVRKDINGNYLVSYTYYYEDYSQSSYNSSYTTVPDWWTVPNDGTIYDHTTEIIYAKNSGAFHSGIMVFDNNWNILTNKINIYVPNSPTGDFSMHSAPATAGDPNFLRTANDVYSLASGGILCTGAFCSTEFALWTGMYRYFTGAYITDVAQNITYTKMFLSTFSENKLKATYFDGTYYYLFIEDTPLTTSTTNYFSSFFPGSYAAYPYKRLATARTITNKKDLWILKLTNTLQVISETSIGCNDDTFLSSVIKKDNSNNLILSCYTKGGVSFDKTTLPHGGFDYWLVELNTSTMSKVTDWGFGASADDILTYTNNQLGFFQYTGTSKSGINGDKTEISRDGGTLGDYWTLSYCIIPTADFTANYDSTDSGNLVSFTNLSTYTSEFVWDFGDGTTSFDANPVHYYYMPGYYNVSLNAINPVGCSDSIIKTNFIYVNPVGIIEAIGEKKIIVFPNPATDRIYVTTPEQTEIKICDSFGRLVKEVKISNENDKTIDVSTLKNGMYFLSILNFGHVTNLKFIKN